MNTLNGAAGLPSPKTVAEELAHALRRHGVEVIFGQSLPPALIMACHKIGIRQIAYRKENMGGTMADGYARVSGRIGVVTAQNGPAATLLVPPLAEALKASIPVVALVQDVPRDTRDRNAFQEFDQISLFQPVAKWVGRVDVGKRAVDYLDMAITAATSGRPGPAVVLLPQELIWEPSCDESQRVSDLGHYPLDRVQPAPEKIAEAAQMIAAARHPVVVAGGGIHSSGAAVALATLQAIACLPVTTTVMGKGAVAEDHPLSLGVLAYFSGSASLSRLMRPIVQESDLVVLIGTRTNQNGTESWTNYPRSSSFIHIDADGQEIGRNYEAKLRLVGDACATIEALTAELRSLDLTTRHEARPELEARIEAARTAFGAEVEAVLRSEDRPIKPQRVVAEIARLIRAEDIVVTDASYSSVWVAAYIQASRPGQRFIMPRGLGGLGWGLPLAMGAKVAHPGARVICLAGDGGFGHSWAEIETLVRHKIAVTMVVLNNGILGYQKHAESARYGAYSDACDFSPVDHAAIARACGCDAVRVEDPSDLSSALSAALDSDHATIIDIVADQNAYPPLTIYEGKQVLGGRRSEPVNV